MNEHIRIRNTHTHAVFIGETIPTVMSVCVFVTDSNVFFECKIFLTHCVSNSFRHFSDLVCRIGIPIHVYLCVFGCVVQQLKYQVV
jgi:hypothetical protein